MTKFLINSNIVCPEVGKTYPRIVYGKGIYLYDDNGKRYIDASGGAASVSNIGHGNAELAKIMEEQVKKVCILPSHAFSSWETEDYLEQLVAFAPHGFRKAWTSSSGTEGVENALKLAVQYHQLRGEPERYKVIGRWSSYHGNSIFTLDVGGMRIRRNSFIQLMNNFPHIAPAYCYRCPFESSIDCCSLKCAQDLERAIVEEGPETIAAFVVEPVVGAALGSVPAPEGYFQEIRRICDKYGILLVIDEVMTGFGRTGKNFGIDNWDVIPDIIAAGKGITSGYYPLSAIIAHSKVTEVFEDAKKPFMGGHTYACNPFGSVVASYVLNYILEKNLIDRAKIMGDIFMEKLSRLYKLDIVGDIRGMGLLLGIELVKDKTTRLPFPKEANISKKIGEIAISKGVILYPGKGSYDGENGDHILIAPPLTIEEHELEFIVQVIEESIIQVENQFEDLKILKLKD